MIDQNFVLPEHNARRSQTRVFGLAHWVQSQRRQQRWSATRKHPDRPCWLGRPLPPRTLLLAPSLWHSFHRTPVAWQPSTVWGLQGGGRRVEDRKDGMFCVFCLKWGCCIYSFLSFPLLFLSFFVPPDFLTLTLRIIKGQGENNHHPLNSHPNPFYPSQKDS